LGLLTNRNLAATAPGSEVLRLRFSARKYLTKRKLTKALSPLRSVSALQFWKP
jgi:hypothetical protein